MNHELLAVLEYLEQERGVSKDQLIDAVEKALLTASRKSIHPASELEVKVDKKTGDISAWAKLTVVAGIPENDDQITLVRAREQQPKAQVGDVIRWEVTPKNFGRIAAQTAKQAILQQIRKAEKETVQEEFKDQQGQLVTGIVRRFEAGSIIVEMDKSEGILLPKDKVPGEQYMPGDRITALLLKVDIESTPSLILSRASTDFILRLFEREVTEIHDGVVVIAAIAREPGSRTKVAVRSTDERIDPVGACVGMHGMRVKNITGELGGERIDIVNYSENPLEYIANAMHPAKAISIDLNEEAGVAEFHVSPDDSRLAFGKKAQNVRLAQKLTQWKIDIIVDEPEKPEVDAAEAFEEEKAIRTKALSETLGVKLETAEKLVGNGYLSLEGVKAAPAADIEGIEGIASDELAKIKEKISGEKPE